MYTVADKAIVAFIMAGVQATNLFGFHFGLDQATVTLIVTAATPILVWFVPNLPKD